MQHIERAQRKILQYSVTRASSTVFGREHGFDRISSYEAFVQQVGLNQYHDLQPYIERIKRGEANVLWPGRTSRFSITAGTTGDPKQIPLTQERLKSDVAFLRRVALNYLKHKPNVFNLLGTHVSLPGSIETSEQYPGMEFGEISGFLAINAPGWITRLQLLPPDEIVRMNFEDKFNRALKKAPHVNARAFTAIPSWTLRFFQVLLEESGKESMAQVWPGLKVVVNGGEPLRSYKPHLMHLCKGLDVTFIETYGASEGYFAFNAEENRDDLQLVADRNIFYEWIPYPPTDKDELKKKEAVPTWQVEKNIPYAMVVTTDNGLWRYCMNDIIMFTDLEQPRIRVHGRINDVLDLYGEAVDIYHIDRALKHALEQTGGEVSNFSVGSLLLHEWERPTHVWFVEWVKRPDDIEQFHQLLDKHMQQVNHSYAMRRETNAIAPPRIFSINKQIIDTWQKQSFTVAAQTKFPKIIHDQDKCVNLMKLGQEELISTNQ